MTAGEFAARKAGASTYPLAGAPRQLESVKKPRTSYQLSELDRSRPKSGPSQQRGQPSNKVRV
jgi:hypothetical protein